jgi:hypothetical protein
MTDKDLIVQLARENAALKNESAQYQEWWRQARIEKELLQKELHELNKSIIAEDVEAAFKKEVQNVGE